MVSLGLNMLLSVATLVGANGPACTQPDTLPAVASMPTLPAILHNADEHGTAQLLVTLTPDSDRPSKVELVESSGYEIVDAAAIDVVRRSAFTLQKQACAPVGGQYFLAFDY